MDGAAGERVPVSELERRLEAARAEHKAAMDHQRGIFMAQLRETEAKHAAEVHELRAQVGKHARLPTRPALSPRRAPAAAG